VRALLALVALVVPLEASSLEPVRLSPSAWFVRGDSGLPSSENRGFNSNAGFVVTSEGVVVFDALGTPALGAELLAEIRRHTAAPVRRVIVSHYHADHFYGLAPFKAAGAEVWAHRDAQAYLASAAPKERLAERSRTLAPWVPADLAFVAADRWIDKEEAFTLGGLRFRVIPVGPAHTREDLALLVEGEGVLFVGDLMFAGRLPFVGDADSRGWIGAIDRVVRYRPVVMVGGHGDASRDATSDLRLTRDYLVHLRKTMGDAANELVDFEEAYREADWSRFAHLPAFEAANRRNAYNTYIRMQGGDK
jgi:glyoxylase-like metal-dependent hydrolase (beta-lactamase superfamily II)